MRRFLIWTALFAGAILIAPGTISAQDHDRRYYDRDGHDYHTWNVQEDRAYRVYLGEQHREYRDFRRVKVVQHFKVEVR
jgi:hypothetical protein